MSGWHGTRAIQANANDNLRFAADQAGKKWEMTSGTVDARLARQSAIDARRD